MELINNFSEIFLSVWYKGILDVDIFHILIFKNTILYIDTDSFVTYFMN